MGITKFEATLTHIGGYDIIHLPKGISATFSSRSLVMAEGTINGNEFHAPLEPDGQGSHWLSISQELLRITGLQPGDKATVMIRESKHWTEPILASDVITALHDHPDVYSIWMSLTVKSHWEWFRWINATKSEITRAKRIAVMLDKLLKGDRRPCCFNRNICTRVEVSSNGILLHSVE